MKAENWSRGIGGIWPGGLVAGTAWWLAWEVGHLHPETIASFTGVGLTLTGFCLTAIGVVATGRGRTARWVTQGAYSEEFYTLIRNALNWGIILSVTSLGLAVMEPKNEYLTEITYIWIGVVTQTIWRVWLACSITGRIYLEGPTGKDSRRQKKKKLGENRETVFEDGE